MVDLRNSHVIQLLELPIQALLEAPVNNFSLVGTFSSYNEELTVVGNIVSGEEFFLRFNLNIGLSLKDQALSTIVNTFSVKEIENANMPQSLVKQILWKKEF